MLLFCFRCYFVFTLASCISTSTRAEKALLQSLRPEHPRVMATSKDFRELRKRMVTDAELRSLLDKILGTAQEKLGEPLLERKQTGRRLLSVSREAVERITNLAMAYHLTGDKRFARRAEEEMLNVCRFSDWNPSHFLDVAEMAAAVGLGYDWLYDELSEENRKVIRESLCQQSLRLVPGKKHWWKRANNNWNSVCWGGLVIAALAVADEEPELAASIIREVKNDNPQALSAYEPDGVYPEGPGYWVYGTTYQVMLISALESALEDDLGLATPGFLASSRFLAHATGPTGKAYNFGDGGENVGTPGVLNWFSQQPKSPNTMAAIGELTGKPYSGRMLPFLALWKSSTRRSGERLPLSWCGQGEQPLAMFRTSWTDPNAMYLAVKGGRATINHGHMDAGSFVLDADGIRWAIDLGGVSYHKYETKGIRLFDKRVDGDRWKVFPHVNYTHNTLTVNDQFHATDGQALITNFDPLDRSRGSVTIDFSEVFSNVQLATRRFLFDKTRRQVTINDRLQGVNPETPVRWTMVTQAKPKIMGNRVELRQSGKSLVVTANSNTNGEWNAEPCSPPKGMYGEDPRGRSLLTWNAKAPEDGSYEVIVTLTPGKP